MNRILLRILWLILTSFLLLTPSVAAQSTNPAKEVLVLTNVTVIDGNGGTPMPKMTLLISKGRITDIFPSGQKKLPDKATVMDFTGHYVIPGLIDSHYHVMSHLYERAEAEARLRFALLGGVTTVRDMGGDAILLSVLAKKAQRGDYLSPRVYFSALMAGPGWFSDPRVAQISHGMYAGEAPWARAVTPTTDIPKVIAEARQIGATGVKLYSHLPKEYVAKIASEAHRQGLKVWAHSFVPPTRPIDVVSGGVDVISHSDLLVYQALPVDFRGQLDWKSVAPVDSPAIVELFQSMRKRGALLDDTLYTTIDNPSRDPNDPRFDGKGPTPRELWIYGVTKLAHQLGVTIVAGTDPPERPGGGTSPIYILKLNCL